MADALPAQQSTSKAASIKIDGQRVPLTREGIERAQANHGNVGKKLADAVRTAVGAQLTASGLRDVPANGQAEPRPR
jgi:hypothetical protein